MKHCQYKTQSGGRGTGRQRECMLCCTRRVFIPPMLPTPCVCVCVVRERKREIEINGQIEME
jgi:hypothetical protein